MSARENVYMNAAMNGIRRVEVERRFDNIIEFAELQDFVDTPLQYYSSGMYLRLAFSVAINMDPAILLADEILAVGDMAFQERCLTKVRELARDRGLTVLFVSHDMEAVSRICDRVIWLKTGLLHRDGQSEHVVTEYQNATWELLTAAKPAETQDSERACRYGEILEVKLLSADGREIGSPPRSEDVCVRIRFRTMQARSRVRCAFELYSKGVLVLRSAQPNLALIRRGRSYEALARIPANLLAETSYTINAGVTLIRGEGEEHELVLKKALAFMVYGEQGVDSGGTLQRKGVVDPMLEWSWSHESEQNAISLCV
jgi:lipopolysaccharide transport system ATP-binding protein